MVVWKLLRSHLRTIYLEHTPLPDWEKGRGFGWSEEKYEQIAFQCWDESQDGEKAHYEACDPFWMRISNAQDNTLFLRRPRLTY